MVTIQLLLVRHLMLGMDDLLVEREVVQVVEEEVMVHIIIVITAIAQVIVERLVGIYMDVLLELMLFSLAPLHLAMPL